jgi:hypothetical protein
MDNSPATSDRNHPLPKLGYENGSLKKQPLPDGEDWTVRMGESLGLKDRELVWAIVSQLISAVCQPSVDKKVLINAAIAAVAEMRPRDPAETMLACQMVVCNTAVMGLMEKVIQRNYSEESVQIYLKNMGLLQKTYARQMDALTRYRRKGQQKMVVEHVTVANGGQAVIGNLTSGGRGND